MTSQAEPALNKNRGESIRKGLRVNQKMHTHQSTDTLIISTA